MIGFVIVTNCSDAAVGCAIVVGGGGALIGAGEKIGGVDAAVIELGAGSALPRASLITG